MHTKNAKEHFHRETSDGRLMGSLGLNAAFSLPLGIMQAVLGA
jgi:hypothetical protein